jgi:Flp pilus assembly protein TadD
VDTIANDDRRIRQLIEAATQAFATGQAHQGERLVQMAEAEAPQHPLVLNETARRMLLGGHVAAANEILERAVRLDPSVPSVWLNLAAALRGLNRPEDEMAALEKVLSIQPNNPRALLQKASLQEIKGKPRQAAMDSGLARNSANGFRARPSCSTTHSSTRLGTTVTCRAPC